MRRVVDEKEKQIEILREREANLNLECIKFKNTIQQLTETGTESNNSLIERVEMLERDKCQLEADLSMERSRRLSELPTDMIASVAGRYFLFLQNLVYKFFIEYVFFIVSPKITNNHHEICR